MKTPRPKFADESAVDELFQQFVRELESYSTNGVVKRFDLERLWPIAQHYIQQCSEIDARVDLEERIRLLLASKCNYTARESKLQITENLEKSVRDKIREILRENLKNAGKFAGMVLNWTIIRPFQILKDVVQPVVANTVLTYAVAVHPPCMTSVEIMVDDARTKQQSAVVVSDQQTERNYDGLQSVKQYSAEDLSELTKNARNQGAEEKKSVHQSVASRKETIARTTTPVTPNVSVDIERGRVVPGSSVAGNVPKETPVSHAAKEIRPIGLIQQTIGLHENKILNSYQSYKKTYGKKTGRIAVKMVVNPRGVAKDVQIISNSFNKEFGNRVLIQLKSIPFTEVDSRLGDQTIYHTFYF